MKKQTINVIPANIVKKMWDLEEAIEYCKAQGFSVHDLAKSAISEGAWPFAEKIHKVDSDVFKGISGSCYENGCAKALWGADGGSATHYYCAQAYPKFTGKPLVWTKKTAEAAYLHYLDQGWHTYLAELATESGIKPDWKKLEHQLKDVKIAQAVANVKSTLETAKSRVENFRI